MSSDDLDHFYKDYMLASDQELSVIKKHEDALNKAHAKVEKALFQQVLMESGVSSK